MEKHRVRRNTKGRQPPKRKTDRKEMTPFQRGLVVNLAETGISHTELAQRFNRSQAAVSKLIQRTKERAEAEGLPLTAEELYQNPKTRARKPILDEQHKDLLEHLVTRSAAHAKLDAKQIKARWESIGLPADFPDVSASTIESALYERGYHRVRHQIKPTDRPEFLAEPNALQDVYRWEGDAIVNEPPTKGNGHRSYYYSWGKVNSKDHPGPRTARTTDANLAPELRESLHQSDSLEKSLQNELVEYNQQRYSLPYPAMQVP